MKIIILRLSLLLMWFCSSLALTNVMAQGTNTQASPTVQFAIVGSAPVISFGGMQAETADGNYFVTVMVGQAFAGRVEGTNQQNAPRNLTGFWSQLLRAPNPPVLETTRGDFNDKVVVRWFNDPLSPAINPTANQPFFTLRREGTRLSDIRVAPDGDGVQEFEDSQAQPGLFYNYSMIGFNSFGSSPIADNLGFRSATGLVQGIVRTPNFAGQPGRPVPDVRVSAIPVEAANTGAAPYVGTSVRLDGTASYLQTTRFMQLPANRTFTIESYVLLNRGGLVQPIFSGLSNVASSRVNLFINENNHLVFQVGGQQVTGSLNPIPAGEWVHIAGVSTPTGLTIYVNKEVAGSVTFSSGQPALVQQLVHIGRMTSNYFHGHIDELKIWSVARTPEQISLFADVTASARDSNLLAYWNFNENTGTIAVDWTRNGNELRLFDGVQWSNQPAPVLLAAITGADGRYVVEGISYNYSAGSQYQVEAFKPFHNFIDPSFETVTFRESANTSTVNFTDRSEIVISGKVLFQGTAIGADSVEIRYATRNGSDYNDFRSFQPNPVYTDSRGDFVVSFLPETPVRLAAFYKDHEIVFRDQNGTEFPFFQDDALRSPRSELRFIDKTTYDLAISVRGGDEQFPIGAFAVQLIGRSPSGINFPETGFLRDTTTAAGIITIRDLPPVSYDVNVTHLARPDSISFASGRSVSLRDSSNTLALTWYAPLEVQIAGLEAYLEPQVEFELESGNIIQDIFVLRQNQIYPLTVEAFERYGNQKSIIRNASVVFLDDISGLGRVDTVAYENGLATYYLQPYLPSFATAGERPFQRAITAIIEDDRFGRTSTATTWVMTEGVGEGGNIFLTESPDVPLLILYDPPGDMSYSYIEEMTSSSVSIRKFSAVGNDTTRMTTVHLGPAFTQDFSVKPFGIGAGISIDVAATADLGSGREASVVNADEYENIITQTFRQRITTSQGNTLVGRDADLFMGASFSFVNGIADSLGWNRETRSIEVSRNLLSAFRGFETTFMFTRHAIQNNVIPNLLDNRTQQDTIRAQNWIKMLEDNAERIKNAPAYKFPDSTSNISFSGGGSLERSVTSTRSSTTIVDFESVIDTTRVDVGGLRVGGIGGTREYTIRNRLVIGKTDANVADTTTTVGFVLADSDDNYPFSGRADQFSVDIKRDLVYGTPIFNLVAGESSNPWEPGTLRRELPDIQINPQVVNNVASGEPAVFTLVLSNLSQTQETRQYLLGVNQETNTNGAKISINGVTVESGILVTIPGELTNRSVTAVLTLEQGPLVYNYDDVELFFRSVSDPNVVATARFSASFIEPCSEVEFFSMNENWMATQATNNQFPISLSGYNRFDPNLEQIVVEYLVQSTSFQKSVASDMMASVSEALAEDNNAEELPHLNFAEVDLAAYHQEVNARLQSLKAAQAGGAPVSLREHQLRGWDALQNNSSASASKASGESEMEIAEAFFVPIMVIPRDSLDQNLYSLIWDISDIADGEYTLRARTECGTDNGSSTKFLTGIIDRRGPTLMPGVSPEPADGVLNLGDQINFTFNENIVPLAAYDDSIRVTNLSKNELVAKSWFVEDNKLYIGLEVDNRFIERDRLEIELRGITDERGNAQDEPITYSFIVNRNQVEWERGNAEIALYPNISNQFTYVLENKHLEEMTFELSSLPSWMRAFPETGSIPAKGTRTITFEVDPSLNFGLYRTTINAETLNGIAPLVLELRIMAEPPQWTAAEQKYQYSMSIIGQLFIGSDTPSNDPYDMVGAFIGDDPRGRALVRSYPSLNDSTRHLVMLTVFSNEPADEIVDLRVWDAINGVEYANTTRQYPFQANTVIGSLQNPVDIRTTRDIFYRRPIPAGWSWISYNVLRDNDFIDDYVGRFVRASDGDIVKNKSGFLVYTEGIGWAGTLTGIDITSGYMLRMTEANLIETAGAPVRPAEHPITIESGWNFIGYTPDRNYTVNYALSDRSFREGDFIKGQNSFAFYSESLGWVGSLTFMRPTEAYMLRVAEAGNFVYPSVDEVLMKKPDEFAEPEEIPENILAKLGGDINPSDFEFNMTVTAVIAFGDSLDAAEHYVLAALVDEDLRGVATPTMIDGKPYFFIMIYDNVFQGSEIVFRFMDTRSGIVEDLEGTLVFRADRVVGNLREPHMLREPSTHVSIGDDDTLPRHYALGKAYPNPFNPSTIIPYELAEESMVNIVVFDVTGRQVLELARGVQPAGRYEVMLQAGGLSSGVYFIRMTAGAHTFTGKVTLIK